MTNVALFGWPVLLFILAQRVTWHTVVIFGLLGGYLLLPTQGGLDLPLLPILGKHSIPCITLVLLALILKPGEAQGRNSIQVTLPILKDWLPRSLTGKLLLSLLVVGAFGTVLTNSDPMRFSQSPRVIPGLRIYDAFSILVNAAPLILSVLLGRKFFGHPSSHRTLLLGLVIAGIGYSFLALIEIRLSPQINSWVYGFFPHNWAQHIRGGGYRPLVFMSHGLVLSIFFAMTIIAATGLWRSETSKNGKWAIAAAWLLVTLFLSKSLGALMIALAMVPLVLLFNARSQVLVAGCIAALVATYPFLRGADIAPVDWVVETISEIDETRAASFSFRLRNEDEILNKANERPLFGWGTFGRNRVFDDFGRDQSTVDGAWIVIISSGGWVRYVSVFGLMCFPVILLAVRRKRYPIDRTTSALCIVVTANLIDLIPNGSLGPLTWLLVGALLGRLEVTNAEGSEVKDSDISTNSVDDRGMVPKPKSPYTRQTTVHSRSNSKD